MTEGKEAKVTPPVATDEELDPRMSDPWARNWFEEHLTELQQDVYGQRLLYISLALGFVLGLAAHVAGYTLRSPRPQSPLDCWPTCSTPSGSRYGPASWWSCSCRSSPRPSGGRSSRHSTPTRRRRRRQEPRTRSRSHRAGLDPRPAPAGAASGSHDFLRGSSALAHVPTSQDGDGGKVWRSRLAADEPRCESRVRADEAWMRGSVEGGTNSRVGLRAHAESG